MEQQSVDSSNNLTLSILPDDAQRILIASEHFTAAYHEVKTTTSSHLNNNRFKEKVDQLSLDLNSAANRILEQCNDMNNNSHKASQLNSLKKYIQNHRDSANVLRTEELDAAFSSNQAQNSSSKNVPFAIGMLLICADMDKSTKLLNAFELLRRSGNDKDPAKDASDTAMTLDSNGSGGSDAENKAGRANNADYNTNGSQGQHNNGSSPTCYLNKRQITMLFQSILLSISYGCTDGVNEEKRNEVSVRFPPSFVQKCQNEITSHFDLTCCLDC